mgnify:CR=1 FL=1
MTLWWFVAFVVLLVIELATVNLVTIWFAIGAVAAIIASVFTESVVWQSVVFILVSLISLIFTKPVMQKFRKFEMTPTNSDRVIGKIGEVTKKIDKNHYGEVKVFESTWTAASDGTIDVGEKVKVLSIEGVKLIVEKEEK